MTSCCCWDRSLSITAGATRVAWDADAIGAQYRYASQILLQFFQGIQIPGIDHQGFLADRIRANPQSHPAMSIMQVIRGADRKHMDTFFFRPAAQFFQVPVESFEFGEEAGIKTVLVQ